MHANALHSTRRSISYQRHREARNRQYDLMAAAVASCLFALGCPVNASAQPPTQTHPATQTWNLASGSLDAALKKLAVQSQYQIVYAPTLVEGKRTRGLAGQYTAAEALKRLLAGTGLTADALDETTFVLKPVPAATPVPPRPVPATRPPRVLEEANVTDIETVAVTGTRIRGGATPSPVIKIGLEQIREEGFVDLGEVIRSIPQNFSGGQNPGAISGNLAGAGLANQNVTGGSSLNLRGLGPSASVTLLNGRRMPYGGFVQSVDISAIPVSAIERVEIVTDGASAIYGADAVGGVANAILLRDFEGVSLGARYGTATDGGLATREYTATAGTTWASGGLIATYKDASVDPIFAADRRYTDHLVPPTTIYPGSDLRSGLFSAHQSIGERAELRLDALRTEREQDYSYFLSGRITRVAPETTTTLVSPSVEFQLANDWTLSLSGAWGKDEHLQVQAREVLGTGVSVPQIDDCYCNRSRMYEVGAEGPLFSLNDGDARIALGTGYRANEYVHYSHLTNTTITRGRDSSRYAYAEMSLPFISPSAGRAGVQRLELTAAVRREDYGSGSATTPKLGVIYGPTQDFTLKASWGKAFKMPTLYERHYGQRAALYDPAFFGATGYPAGGTALTISGGNPSLEPEHARTWTASLAFHPEALPGLNLELTWFGINYSDRVVEPITNFAEAMTNPVYATFVDYTPTPDEQAAILSAVGVFSNYAGVPYDPDDVFAILYFQYVNASDQRIKGVDLSGEYALDVGAGHLTVRGSASYLDSTQRISDAQNAYDLAGTLHNPAKLNSRIGAVWNQGGFTGSIFANYKGGVTNTANGEETASFTTLDATLRYGTGQRGTAWSGLEFGLSAQNLLDRAPPLYTPAPAAVVYLAPFDSTNYSAIGRYLSAWIAKRW